MSLGIPWPTLPKGHSQGHPQQPLSLLVGIPWGSPWGEPRFQGVSLSCGQNWGDPRGSLFPGQFTGGNWMSPA